MGCVASTAGSKNKTFHKALPTEEQEEADQKYIKEVTEVGISTASEETKIKTSRPQTRSSSKTPTHTELEQTPRQSKIKTPRSRNRSHPKSPRHSEFENEDGENVILEGNWEVEKGKDEGVDFFHPSYPDPRPQRTSFQLDKYDFYDADRRGLTYIKVHLNNNDIFLETPPKTSSSFSELAEYLTKDFSTDVYKVRAITVWISAQNIRTHDYGDNIEENTPLAYMKRIKENRGTFAGLFALICRAAKLPCVIVRGVCKTGHYVIGEKDLDDSPSTWNAVYFDGQWNIIHPFFICTPLVNITSDASWRLVYEGNKELPATYSKKRVFNEFFFCPNPEDFIHVCFPDRLFTDWQLLETRLEMNQFLCLPYLRPYFFKFGFKLKNEQTCEIEMKDNVVSIEMEGKKDLLEGLTVSCNVYTQSEGETSTSDWATYIICGRIIDSWKVEMRFPVKGVFKCALYAIHENHNFWLGDFKIMCHSVSQSFGQLPIDPGTVGWGPSQACNESGLCAPSHIGGIVQVRENEVHVFKFLLMKYVTVKIDLVNDLMSKEMLEKSVEKRYDRKNKELDIVVTIPGRGEYALRLYVMSSTGEYENVCNYLLTDSDTKFPKTKRETVPQKKARERLRQGTIGDNPDVLQKAIQDCEKFKVDQDGDTDRARRRLHYLQLKKGLREAIMRRNHHILDKAIDEAIDSPYRDVLKPNIEQADALLTQLINLESHCHDVLEIKQTTISELANYANPPREVYETMKATFFLLKEDKGYLESWADVQGLLHKQGKDSIISKIRDFNGDVEHKSLNAAEKILNTVSEDKIHSASAGAASFYKWSTNVIKEIREGTFQQNTSQNATDDTQIIEEDFRDSPLDNDESQSCQQNSKTKDEH